MLALKREDKAKVDSENERVICFDISGPSKVSFDANLLVS